MSDILKLYDPANAAALTEEQTEGLQQLTSAEIKELAKKFPNSGMTRAYLLIIDSRKPVQKQLPTLSSFENLYNLREKNGQKHFVAYRFRTQNKPGQKTQTVRAKRSEVIDLSDKELLDLPGFKSLKDNTVIPPSTVEVTKVRKKKKDTKPE